MKFIRVFPRKTNATPDDDLVRLGPPGLFNDDADRVHISVTFLEDRKRGEFLYNQWKHVTRDIQIGGPAYDDSGGEFEPGVYLKKGYVITSRGCPNKCWFCYVPKREGMVWELQIKDGWIVQDNNLLACSDDHIRKVFIMLQRQEEAARFTGGFEAARFRPWIADELRQIRSSSVYFSYDTSDDYEPLVYVSNLLRRCGELPSTRHRYKCYVLVGFKGDSFDFAEDRIRKCIALGFMPSAMLFDYVRHKKESDGWTSFLRQWSNKIIVGVNMKKYMEGRNAAAH